jgi:hypothetical protein
LAEKPRGSTRKGGALVFACDKMTAMRKMKSFLAELLFVADLIYYNGPRCSHYTRGKRHYILWNIEDEPMRWVLMEFQDRSLIAVMLENKLACRELFKQNREMWLIEGDEPLIKPMSVKPVEYAELPQQNLPKEGVNLYA